MLVKDDQCLTSNTYFISGGLTILVTLNNLFYLNVDCVFGKEEGRLVGY